MLEKYDLIKDLIYLHEKAGIKIEEVDDELLVLCSSNKKMSDNEIYEEKTNLYLEYTRGILFKIEENLNKLLKSFSDIKNRNEKLSLYFRELGDIDILITNNNNPKKTLFKEIKSLFEKVNDLDNDILDNGNIICSEGRMRFIKVFLPFLAITSVVYGWAMKEYFQIYLLYSFLGWTGVSILTWILLHLLLRFFVFRKIKLK